MSPPIDLLLPGARPLGIIGLGLIGGAIAGRLREGGFSVTGYDLAVQRMDELRQQGGTAVANAEGVFAACDGVLLSLPSHREVEAVIVASDAALRPGLLIIDTTTGDPKFTETLARKLAGRGVHYLDATVSGNSAQLRQGAATLMVGGEADAFASAARIFESIGQRTFHTGPAGSGARMKLVTNLVLGLNRAALAEGLVFAQALGLDPALTLAVMKGGAAYAKIMDVKGEKMIHGEFSPDARLSQHLKDVRLIVEAGEQAGLPMPLSLAHRAVLEAAEAAGWGDLDNSALIKALGVGKIVRGQ